MNILDYIILAVLAVSVIVGFIKGLLKQLLTVVGIVVVVTLTATVTPWVQSWLVGVIESEGTRAAVAMFAAVILLAAVYGIVAAIIGRLLKKVKFIKALDKILGGVMGVVVVYIVFAVVFALFNDTSTEFLPRLRGLLGEAIENSWFNTHIYSNNFFGDWVINGIAERLIQSFQPATE